VTVEIDFVELARRAVSDCASADLPLACDTIVGTLTDVLTQNMSAPERRQIARVVRESVAVEIAAHRLRAAHRTELPS
jgi:hypothetical protein